MSRPCRKTKLHLDDYAYFKRRLSLAKKDSEEFAGLWYTMDLAGSGGVTVTFFVPPDTPKEQIDRAKSKALSLHDVVDFLLMSVPGDFVT